MKGPLHGLTILVPESRELDLFASMLEDEGAAALRCPLVRILDLEDDAEAKAWIAKLVAGRFQDIIWLTGEGIRRLATMARGMGIESQFQDALEKTRAITRGPKPARALREMGLSPGLAATVPTSRGVLDALSGEELTGRAMGVQLYPDAGPSLTADLTARGAQVFPVTPYRYASQAETHQVSDVIGKLARGEIDLVAFTATPQIERLFAVARETGLEDTLRRGLDRTPIAAIGPVLEDCLSRHGLSSAIRPASSFHLKPLVRAIIAWRSA